ncbi:MAG: S24 family peptidase [Geminicoccaceae bacterium]
MSLLGVISLFTHPQVWDGIDKLAKEKGWSPSKLAREAGLDPTTFNKSKRHTNQDKPRWPSTESLAKILDATNTQLEYFVGLMSDQAVDPKIDQSTRLRCLSFEDAAESANFDNAGFPVHSNRDEIDFPGLVDQHAFAIEVRGHDFLPIYRDGDLIVISPSSNVRRRDRVILKTTAGALEIGTLARRTAQRLELDQFNGSDDKISLNVRDVAWLSRIVWASQ